MCRPLGIQHPTPSDEDRLWVRVTLDVDNGSGGYDLTFYYSDDDAESWIQIGSTITGGITTSIASASIPLEVGTRWGGVNNPMLGRVYRAKVFDGIDGTLVFDAHFEAEGPGTTSFTESSSEAATVTINQSGSPAAQITQACGLQLVGIAPVDRTVVRDLVPSGDLVLTGIGPLDRTIGGADRPPAGQLTLVGVEPNAYAIVRNDQPGAGALTLTGVRPHHKNDSQGSARSVFVPIVEFAGRGERQRQLARRVAIRCSWRS